MGNKIEQLGDKPRRFRKSISESDIVYDSPRRHPQSLRDFANRDFVPTVTFPPLKRPNRRESPKQ